MSGKEYTAKTIEEALEKALNEMMLTRDDIEYEVITHPSKGFLGFGQRDAVVRVKKKVIEELKDIVNDIKEERKEEVICQKTMEQPKVAEVSVEEKTIEPEKEVLVEEPVPAAEETIEMTEAAAVVETIVEPQEQAVMENAEQKKLPIRRLPWRKRKKGTDFFKQDF